MKFLAILFLLLIAGYAYPSLNEDVSSNCQAVETKLLALSDIPMGKVLTSLSHGEFGKAIAKNQFPDLPPQIGCTVAYWDIWLKKEKYRQTLKQLLSS